MLFLLALLLQIHSIIPQPSDIQTGDGEFVLSGDTQIVVDGDRDQLLSLAVWLKELIGPATMLDLPILVPEQANSASPMIRLVLSPVPNENPEAYSLVVAPRQITIESSEARGIFYGLQTLRQLMPEQIEHRNYTMVPGGTQWSIPAVEINDEPRFGYRGMHLDVGRHFMPVDFVKRYIDLLAMHKMNTFHWHLTEDQGWRIEIKQYPRLTEVGAWRDSTIIGHHNGNLGYDQRRYGGYYTQEQIREVVQYAADRFITVIPEIEMPGHASAALAAYPELGCHDGPYHVKNNWGIHDDIFCPKEETFTFLENVLTEVMNLFPSTFIHVGGDEAPKRQWEESDLAQDVIAREGLESEEELQSYFIQRIARFLEENGRRLVGWDEILEGGLAQGATVMSWRGEEGGIEAATMGHDAIMTPTSYAYFDYYQSEDHAAEPLNIGGYLPLERVYSYEPIPEELEPEYHHHILGAQGNVWTEYMQTPEKVEYMAFPRVLAMAEVVWSPSERRNWDEFQLRLEGHLKRFDIMGVNYRDPGD